MSQGHVHVEEMKGPEESKGLLALNQKFDDDGNPGHGNFAKDNYLCNLNLSDFTENYDQDKLALSPLMQSPHHSRSSSVWNFGEAEIGSNKSLMSGEGMYASHRQ